MNKNWYTYVVSHLLFPIQERIKSHKTTTILAELNESQWLSPDEIRDYQRDRLCRLMQHVVNHVPYYREWFLQSDLTLPDFLQHGAITRLPILTKEIIRENLEALKSDQAVGLSRFNTGGSSGEPLVFFIGNERVSHDVAAKWRATRWWDVDIGDPEIVVWGSPIELGAQGMAQHLRDRMFRTELLPAFEMSQENLHKFVERIQKARPDMLFGYPSSLAHIATFAQAEGIVLNDLGIKVVFVTSEQLYDEQREVISKIFGCPVANGYGGRDAGFIAHECPAGKLHITAEDIYVEILDNEGNLLPAGEAGEIVVTHFATKDFPFIRYRTGDVGVLSDEICSCGRGLPVLKEVQGRTTDFVVAQDGTVMHGLALIYILRDLDGVALFKITQESLEKTTIEIVVNDEFDRACEAEIVDQFKARLGQSVTIDLQFVETIANEKSGKFRYVKSLVETS